MRALLILVCLALPLTGQQPPPMPGETPYFPLKKGAKWTYRAGPDTVVVTVKDVKKFGTNMEDAYELETTAGGAPQATELIVPRADGLYRVQINNTAVEPPVCFLKLPVKKDNSWNVDSKMGNETLKGKFVSGEEEITVGGTKYKTVTVTGHEMLANGQKMSLVYYFAEKVGMVKLAADLGGVKVTLELEPEKK
jgi:hypothetical protein